MDKTHISSNTNPDHMMAAIDLGTNQIRIEIAEVQPDGQFMIVEQLQQAIALGQDTFTCGRISASTIRSAVKILRDFRQIIELYQIQHIRAVATTAVREAFNSDTLLDRIFNATGIEVNVIEPAEECRLTFTAIRHELGDILNNLDINSLIVDVGGGSTLLSVLHGQELLASQSLPLGSIRLQEVLDTANETPDQAARIFKTRISHEINATGKHMLPHKIDFMIAVGGDIRLLAQECGEDHDRHGVRQLSPSALDRFIKQTQTLSPDQIARQYGISYSQAETLNPALLVYQTILRTCKPKRLLACQSSMRDGLLLDMARMVTGQEDNTLTYCIVQSALTIAEKYQADISHALNVEELSLILFDQLKTDLGLHQRHRLLLRLAAILHEVGKFVSNRAHHKHSYYLITNSELFGINRDDLTNIALIARYHRRSCPKPAHTEYSILARERRLIISKLAALLRMADALDVSHRQPIHQLQCYRVGDELTINVYDVSDLTLERRAMSIKGDLFCDLTGLKVRLESILKTDIGLSVEG